MAPVVATFPITATFTAAATPTNQDLGTVTVSQNTGAAIDTMAPITSVSELTPISSFGGDIVTIAAGPGGVFGNVIYAISRGGGDNTASGAVNRPGVIYRVNPSTGKASVFFDLNTVMSQIDPNAPTAANSLGSATGLVNWYSITFDSEGLFSGTPAMFVSSVDRSDPNKNIIFEIAPNGTLMGVFAQFTDGLSALKFNISPTAILIPPVQDQSFLSGLIGGSGISTTSGTFAALFFSSSSYSPGQTISNATLPNGVSQTNLGLPTLGSTTTINGTTFTGLIDTGPIVGLTASNSDYNNEIFSIFTDFGTPAAGGIPARPGNSGVQGSSLGELLIGQGITQPATLPGTGTTDTLGAVSTQFRRFESIAFDQFGYFSQSVALTAATTTTTGGTRNEHDHVHGAKRAPGLRRELVRQRSRVRLVRDGDAAGAIPDQPDPGARARLRHPRRDHRRIRKRDSNHQGRQFDRLQYLRRPHHPHPTRRHAEYVCGWL
jgi:hypothetical protein